MSDNLSHLIQDASSVQLMFWRSLIIDITQDGEQIQFTSTQGTIFQQSGTVASHFAEGFLALSSLKKLPGGLINWLFNMCDITTF